MLRRVVVAVALCGLLAGCSGKPMSSKPTPTSLDRTICSTVNSMQPHLSPSTGSGTGRASLGISAEFINVKDFASSLVRSHDQVFQTVGKSLTKRLPDGATNRQLHARCSTLGL